MEPMWLSKTALVRLTLVVTTVWWTLGFSMLLFLSALQDIPEQLYEAAKIDGAPSWRALISITIPILGPTFALVTFLQIIASFKVFGQIYLISRGGPGTVTRPIIQYIYTTAFTKNNLGYASAMSYALFLILIGFSLIQLRIQNRKG
jgi:multiple sugar transport system permease protein